MFSHDTEVALANVAALVNTEASDLPGGGRPDLLPDVAALRAFLREWRWSGPAPRTAESLRQVQELRPQFRRLWHADLPAQVTAINAILAEHNALPRLVQHDDYGWHIHAASDDAPLHARMAVEAAMALVDLVRAGETGRLQLCAADHCDKVLVDLSRNRSKIYCDSNCANRAHAAAYRARKSE